jgi:ubiquinone/menaquinone biosynthesis C-methylase UbiE
MQSISYICPKTKNQLTPTPKGWKRDDGHIYAYVEGDGEAPIHDFRQALDPQNSTNASVENYVGNEAVENYKNFLNWLFETFDASEQDTRKSMLAKLELSPGDKVLITGCGLGSDLPSLKRLVGSNGELYAQDFSPEMVMYSQNFLSQEKKSVGHHGIYFSIGSAMDLPFSNNSFDAAFHFGGINVFGDIKDAIHEMDRVVRPGGKVVFGDEGVAPWLRTSEYGKVAINNNNLWASKIPLDELPETCAEVNATWILGNCFYLIDYTVSNSMPHMNMDVKHIGPRGGNMRSRYFGKLEGIDGTIKKKILQAAAKENVSISEWLEKNLLAALNDQK